MAIGLSFDTLIEDRPDAAWQSMFERHWPAYRSWFLRGGVADRPSYLESRRALREHMPELVPIWERLVELAGGGDVEARFLSLWCPPPYIAGCSQAVWFDPRGNDEPALLRNYDFAPGLLEGNWLATRWRGARVLALGDCLWGALDGMNEAGLAASLSFGGRKVTGTGFGIPLLLRYVLETAPNTADAVALLERIPVSMSYNVTLLDRKADAATLFLAPDRPPELTRRFATTGPSMHAQRIRSSASDVSSSASPQRRRPRSSPTRCCSRHCSSRVIYAATARSTPRSISPAAAGPSCGGPACAGPSHSKHLPPDGATSSTHPARSPDPECHNNVGDSS